MEKHWIPLISACVGGIIAIIGGYFNGTIQLRRQQKIERKKILLTKLEETYETVVAVQQALQAAVAHAALRLTAGQLMLEENISTPPVPLEKLHVLVNLYFDDLKTPLETLVRERDKLGEYIAHSVRRHNASESERVQLRSKMHDIYSSEVVCACDGFLSETLKLVKKLL
jgi:hypothetical protein